MHLSVTCPQCSSKYQLDPSMRGKRMRCPNTLCRAIFDVRDDTDPPPAPTAPPTPELTTEAWQPSAPDVKAEPEAPPVKFEQAPAKVIEPPPKPKPKPAEPKRPVPVRPKPAPPPPPADDFPEDFPGDDTGAATPAPTIAAEAWQPEVAPSVPIETPPPRRRRTALWIILSMMLVLGSIAAIGYWRVRTGMESNEAERLQHAEDLYQKHEFAEASAAFQKMQRDFPESANLKKYRFLGELSDVREAVRAAESAEETVETLKRVLQFSSVYGGDPLLKEREVDIVDALHDLTRELTRHADREKTSQLLAHSKHAWAEAKKATKADQTERERKHQDEWTRVEAAIANHVERERVIAVLKKNAEHATASSVAEAWALVEKTKRQDDSEIRSLLMELFKAHREQVTFVAAEPNAKMRAIDEDALPSLSVTPSLHAERALKITGPPILALARGVLYALEPAKGDLLWARRVGIDTRTLPLRVPADSITPETLLVLSSDQRSLSSVIAATGATVWQTPLSDASLAAPVLVDRHVLVPTVAGRIDEIEVAEGRLLGSYHVGQPLTLGGVRPPGSTIVYFPADDFCLYAIDVKDRLCRNILYTRHPSGSLRGLPTVLPDEKGGWLLWAQAHGFDKSELKPYALPIKEHDQKPATPVLQLAGISAQPWHDAHRLAVMTQNGMLSLWGVRDKATRDPLLFPYLPSDVAVEPGPKPGRSDVVHADPENVWVLARGKLHRVEVAFHPSKGPNAFVHWSKPPTLGHLLHTAEARREPDGRTILFVTTQADDRATCLASAIDGESGKVLWQRQLGILPNAPLFLAGKQILVPGPEGILTFSPSDDQKPARWHDAGDWLMRDPFGGQERVVLFGDKEFVELSWRKGATKLTAQIGTPADKKSRTINAALPARLQGTPALGDGFLLLPLANGILARLNLADGALINGPDWRAIGAEEQTLGHVALISSTDFIVTDGSRGLQRIHSTDGKNWDKRASQQLSHRIIKTPLVIAAGEKSKAAVCVIDASDTLTLLDAERLTVLRTWPLGTKVTAGPFLRDGKLGCVVSKNRLIWIDPEDANAMWEYAFVADIVGEPQLIDGMLVVGDVAGQFIGLDPLSGRPLSAGVALKANVAPTASPLPFGERRAFAPLTDGTIVLVPLEKLRP